MPTKSESLEEKKAADCICWHSKDGSCETAVRAAVSEGTHCKSNMGVSWDIYGNTFMCFLNKDTTRT